MNREQAGQMIQLHRRLMMGIEDGKMSTREAQAMMNERGMAIFEAGKQDDRRDRDDRGDRGDSEQSMIDRMIDMVNAGEITREQMQQRLDRMNMRDQMNSEVELDATIAQVEQMLEAGMITPAQLVEGLRKMMSGFKRPALTRADYAEASRKMEAMVESGEITREQMQQRLDRMRMAMGGTKSKAVTKADYKDAEKKMGAMVKAGEITKEQMQQRLDRMKAGMAKDRTEAASKGGRSIPAPPEGLSREELREWFGRMKERLDMAVESGRMTPEEAREMMMQIRSNMR
jgi:polyhydroxyalkanoate synthesis regulator phasin